MTSGSSYTPGREIARGGMGAILSATDQSLDREVAMKVMLEAGERDPVARQRFLREALVLARLEHPNIVPIHEMGRDPQGRRFYTMKLVKGRTLQAIITAIKKGDTATIEHYTLDRLLTIYRKVCDAVSFAHHHRIIHRDLKPENVMVGEFGEVLVMDWGLAKHLDDAAHSQTEAESAAKAPPIHGFQELSDDELAGGAGNLTMEGTVMGSPQYMAPEQAAGRLADIGTHSDIYSLGGVLYAILTLRPPVAGRKVAEVLDNVKSGNITPPTHYGASRAGKVKVSGGEVADASEAAGLPHCPDGKVPPSLSAVTMRAMALLPANRYAGVGQLIADVEAYQGGFATSAENAGLFTQVRLLVRRHKALTVAAVLGVALTIGFLFKVNAEKRAALASAVRANEAEALAKATLTDLRRTAPVFYSQAKLDFQAGNVAAALEKLGYAIQLDDASADYFLLRAHLRQSAQDLTPAAVDYRRVLELRPEDASAKMNLALCEELLRESGGEALGRLQQLQLLNALRAQRRLIEAAPIAALLSPDTASAMAVILGRLPELRKQPQWSPAKALKLLPDGTFRFNYGRSPLIDFSVLKGTLVTGLNLADNGISDLSTLAGLPLKELHLRGSKATDLSPLRGMPLEELDLSLAGGVTDITPLRGMPLRMLRINGTKVTDLSPLAACTTLEELFLPGAARDLSMLRQLPRLRFISSGHLLFHKDDPANRTARNAEEFWREYDAKQKSVGK